MVKIVIMNETICVMQSLLLFHILLVVAARCEIAGFVKRSLNRCIHLLSDLQRYKMSFLSLGVRGYGGINGLASEWNGMSHRSIF